MSASQTDVLEQIVRQSTEQLADGRRDFLVRLRPVALGTVEITLSREEGSYVLKITAQLQTTEALIESDLERLGRAFEALLTQLSLRSNFEAEGLPPVC